MVQGNECQIHSWSVLTDTTKKGRFLLLALNRYKLKEAVYDSVIRRQQIRCVTCNHEEYRGYVVAIPPEYDNGSRYYYYLNEDNTPGKLFDLYEVTARLRRGIDIGSSMRILPCIPSPHLPVLRVSVPTGSEARVVQYYGELNGSSENVLRWVWKQGAGAPGAAQYGAQWYVLVSFTPAWMAYEQLASYPPEQIKEAPEAISYVPPSEMVGIRVAVITDKNDQLEFVRNLASETNFDILDPTTVIVEI
jgi:hypothetical protein